MAINAVFTDGFAPKTAAEYAKAAFHRQFCFGGVEAKRPCTGAQKGFSARTGGQNFTAKGSERAYSQGLDAILWLLAE